MIYLKQNTASQEISLGPFVDSTDGVTAETALTIANTDIKIFKAGASAYASKNSGGATHDAAGNYTATLDATDTNTLGSGKVMVQVSGALPVWDSFVVLAANIYDALIGGGDLLQVDVTEWKGATAPAMTGDAFARLGAPAGASVSADVAAVKTETASIQTDTNDIQTRLPAALVSGRMDSSTGAMAANVLTATAINADAFTAAKFASDVTTELQTGLATATALAAVKTIVDKVDTAMELDGAVYRFTVNALELAPTGGSAPTAAAIADEVQTRTIAAVTVVNGLAANTVTAAALAADAVTEIQSGLATASALTTVDTVVDAVKVKTDQLTFTTGVVHADVKRAAGVVLQQNGSGTQSIGGPA